MNAESDYYCDICESHTHDSLAHYDEPVKVYSIGGHFCGQQQPHGAHDWTAPIPFGSTAITTPRQCAGLAQSPADPKETSDG